MRIPSWLKNKYFVTASIFLVFVLFFDDRDFITNYRRHRQLIKLEKSRQFYIEEIDRTRTELNQLKNNAATLEKYAREKYLMKRDNEDIYLVNEKTHN